MAARPFSDDRARARLRRAVKAVEDASSAEVVVAVRSEADAYPEAGWRAGAAASWLALLYMLFAPPVFELPWIAAIAATSVAVGVAATRALPVLRRVLVGEARRRAMVERAARATFVELGVAVTRARTGILVYVALFERRVAVVADAAIHARVDASIWTRAAAGIEHALDEAGITEAGLEGLANAIEALAPRLAEPLPRAHDDIDELEDVA